MLTKISRETFSKLFTKLLKKRSEKKNLKSQERALISGKLNRAEEPKVCHQRRGKSNNYISNNYSISPNNNNNSSNNHNEYKNSSGKRVKAAARLT
ncbi:myb-like protein L [Drosophila ficusphila]|uniref:myb-like protein L n=1 Tax=Drosophila ficusphila TaxID=30025 RepID=UPI001C8A7C75|nr:myb-like protein L [Drosophila ficusphila]